MHISDIGATQFVQEAIKWPDVKVRRASVNSFGMGGSNAHVVIDDAHGYLISNGILAHSSESSNGQTRAHGYVEGRKLPCLLAWSASDESALQRMTFQLTRHLEAQTNDDTCSRLHIRFRVVGPSLDGNLSSS